MSRSCLCGTSSVREGKLRLRTQSRDKLGVQLGYLDTDGRPSIRGIAELLRVPLSRWGLAPKRAILKYARNELRACGIVDFSNVPRVLQRLIDLGECDAVFVDHEPFLAPAQPCWISIGDGVSAYLGVSEPPEDLTIMDTGHSDIVRRLRTSTEVEAEILELSGVQELSFEEWLQPLGYFRHITRRTRKAVRSDEHSLDSFWELLVNTMAEEGLPLGSDAVVRFLGGRPGTYFGKHNSTEPEGRWTMDPEEGLWCAFRQGYGDGHWYPCIVSVTSDSWRALDLYDDDEWRWAVFARGRRTGAEEVVDRVGDFFVKPTFQVPSQLRAALDILGKPAGPWTWEVNPGSPDLWQLL